jgi:hypothetical protein
LTDRQSPTKVVFKLAAAVDNGRFQTPKLLKSLVVLVNGGSERVMLANFMVNNS